MKIIHYIASIDKTGGGTTEYMRLLGTAMGKRCEMVIATSISPNPVPIEGVRIKYFNTRLKNWFRMLKAFKIFLVQEQPDVIHINGIWDPQNWGFQKQANKLGIKVILSPHGMLEPWILARNPLKKKLALWLYQSKSIKKCNHLHATCEMEKKNIEKLGYTNPVTTIPNAIDLSSIKDIKKIYGTKKIVFLSRIHPKKGIELLLEAWRSMETQNWTLEIAGNGNADYIETLSQSAKDLKNVYFVGAQYGEAKWAFFRSADIMVLPSFSENFGIVVAEALAVGVPAISTQGTPWEDLNNYNCGWWIKLSVTQLQKTLLQVMKTSESSLEKMGKNGLALVNNKYDIINIAQDMYKLYKSV